MYILQHPETIAVVNRCLLQREEQSIHWAKKTLKLNNFQSQAANSLKLADEKAGWPLLLAAEKRKLERKQTNVVIDIQLYHIDFMPLWDN